MSTQYGTIITNEGAALIADCILNGRKLNITEAAAGDGGGAYYQPTVEQTGLINEKWRGEIASAEISSATPNMFDVKIVIGDEVGGFTIREMALIDEIGATIALCNTPDTEKVAISGGVSGKLTMIMHIVVADASVVEFTVNTALDTVSREDLEAGISEHNASTTCHADIRQLALNSVQPGQVYTKAQSDDLTEGAVTAHDGSPSAHAGIQVSVADLDSRLRTMELKYGTNITGNAFAVTFATLTGLVVTGVWNEAFARVEF